MNYKFLDNLLNYQEEIQKNLIGKYRISSWIQYITSVSIIIGVFIQMFYIGRLGAWKFFSTSQVFIDGFLFLGILLYSILITIIGFYILYVFSKINNKLINGIIILFLVAIISLFNEKFDVGDLILRSFIPIIIIPLLFLLKIAGNLQNLFFWSILYMSLAFFSLISQNYGTVRIDDQNYEIKYMSADYIFTKEGFIFDREGNKFIKTP